MADEGKSTPNKADKEKTFTVAEVLAIQAENALLKSKAEPTLFSLKLKDLTSGVLGSIGRRINSAKQADPDFVRELWERADTLEVVPFLFGKSSYGTLTLACKKAAPEKYQAARQLAMSIGLIGRDNAPMPDDGSILISNLPASRLCR